MYRTLGFAPSFVEGWASASVVVLTTRASTPIPATLRSNVMDECCRRDVPCHLCARKQLAFVGLKPAKDQMLVAMVTEREAANTKRLIISLIKPVLSPNLPQLLRSTAIWITWHSHAPLFHHLNTLGLATEAEGVWDSPATQSWIEQRPLPTGCYVRLTAIGATIAATPPLLLYTVSDWHRAVLTHLYPPSTRARSTAIFDSISQ